MKIKVRRRKDLIVAVPARRSDCKGKDPYVDVIKLGKKVAVCFLDPVLISDQAHQLSNSELWDVISTVNEHRRALIHDYEWHLMNGAD